MSAGLQSRELLCNAFQSLWISSSLPALSLRSWRTASESGFSYPSSIPQSLLLNAQGTFITFKQTNKTEPLSHRLLNTYFIPDVAFIYFILWNPSNNHDRYSWGSETGSTSTEAAWFMRMWASWFPMLPMQQRTNSALVMHQTTQSAALVLTPQHSPGHFLVATTV